MRHAERRRGIALRISIDDKHMKPGLRERSRDIDRRRRLTDPALLIGDGDDAGLIRMREAHSSELLQRRMVGTQLLEDRRSRQNILLGRRPRPPPRAGYFSLREPSDVDDQPRRMHHAQ